MKRTHLLFLLSIITILSSCVPSSQYTGVWVDKDKIKGKAYHNIFIIAITANIQARQRFEHDIDSVIISRGLKAVKSIDVMPPSLDDPKKMPTKDEMVAKIKASGCDAVFMVTLLKRVDNVNYTPGQTATAVVPGGSYYGFYNYYYTTTVSTPSYLSEDKIYVMKSDLFDVASEEKMWTAESSVMNPTSLQRMSRIYVNKLVKQLTEQGAIKKLN